jgi:hypothetical protein
MAQYPWRPQQRTGARAAAGHHDVTPARSSFDFNMPEAKPGRESALYSHSIVEGGLEEMS